MRTETDETVERRLAHEAKTVQLGTLYACDPSEVTDSARVEVTYGYTDWDEMLRGPGGITHYDEHAGYYTVHVHAKSPDECADENEAMENHPATLARNYVIEQSEGKGYTYFEVDDVYAA